MMQAKSTKLSVSQSFEAEPEDIEEQAADRRNHNRGQKRYSGPNQTFDKRRLLHRFLFGFAHNPIVYA